MTIQPGITEFEDTEAYLGYHPNDHAKPFAGFFKPADAPHLSGLGEDHAVPIPAGQITPFADLAAALSSPGYLPVETGWGVGPEGAFVAVHTKMPGVSPRMWDWWFAWHGSDAARYKLWHPRAHLLAVWKDGQPQQEHYIGRTSLIKEHIGETYLEGAIRFVRPEEVGFLPNAFAGTVICGRAGEVRMPIEHTWLIHQVRATVDGAEMRSRFYLGYSPTNTETGENIKLLGPPPGAPKPLQLLIHCAEEMQHLAGFLPILYSRFAKVA